jgi:hypothetical protein
MPGKVFAGFEKIGGVYVRTTRLQAVLQLTDLDGAVAASVRSDTGTAAKRTSQSEEKQK